MLRFDLLKIFLNNNNKLFGSFLEIVILQVYPSVLSFAKPLLSMCIYMGLDLDELALTLGKMTGKLCNNCGVYTMRCEGKNCLLFHYIIVLI